LYYLISGITESSTSRAAAQPESEATVHYTC